MYKLQIPVFPYCTGILGTILMMFFTSGTTIEAKSMVFPSDNLTMVNIYTAYTAEVNAQTAYIAYARKAHSEGFDSVESLFRALARTEKVHSDRHLSLLRELGVKPNSAKTPPTVKSTPENLQTTLDIEIYENLTMYPSYTEQAIIDDNQHAITNFRAIGAVEDVHARLIKNMLDNPASWTGEREIYYVCLICGNILDSRPTVCPICYVPGKKFIKVS